MMLADVVRSFQCKIALLLVHVPMRYYLYTPLDFFLELDDPFTAGFTNPDWMHGLFYMFEQTSRT